MGFLELLSHGDRASLGLIVGLRFAPESFAGVEDAHWISPFHSVTTSKPESVWK